MLFKKYVSLIPVIIFFYLQLEGQVKSKYDLLTESYVARPLCMHKGQIQLNSGYEFSIINAKYDQEHEKVDLTIKGSVSWNRSDSTVQRTSHQLGYIGRNIPACF